MTHHARLLRLDRVFASHPVYFITTCTHRRRPILACESAVKLMQKEWTDALERHGWLVGRYVVMPDHVHFFCSESSRSGNSSLSDFIQRWKEWTSKQLIHALGVSVPVWQKQFFDHVLRSGESYAEKWLYVADNPVRAGLVSEAKDWLWQGCIHFDSPLGEV
jgi:REP element-mobilizing transposase RayT